MDIVENLNRDLPRFCGVQDDDPTVRERMDHFFKSKSVYQHLEKTQNDEQEHDSDCGTNISRKYMEDQIEARPGCLSLTSKESTSLETDPELPVGIRFCTGRTPGSVCS